MSGYTLLSSGHTEQEIKGEGRGEGRSKWAKQPSHSCRVRSPCAECGGICLTPEDKTEHDRRRHGQSEAGTTEGRRVEEETRTTLGVSGIYTEQDLVGRVTQGLRYSPALELTQPAHCSGDTMNYLVSVYGCKFVALESNPRTV